MTRRPCARIKRYSLLLVRSVSVIVLTSLARDVNYTASTHSLLTAPASDNRDVVEQRGHLSLLVLFQSCLPWAQYLYCLYYEGILSSAIVVDWA